MPARISTHPQGYFIPLAGRPSSGQNPSELLSGRPVFVRDVTLLTYYFYKTKVVSVETELNLKDPSVILNSLVNKTVYILNLKAIHFVCYCITCH